MRKNRLREIWARGAAATNGWLSIPDGFAAEVMAHQGWDSLTIDLQHGLVDPAAMVRMLQAISTTACVPLVRVSWLEPGALMKALDAGAYGVICPMIESADDARKLVAWTRYAPRGTRSYGPARAVLYGGADYTAAANGEILVFAMIETATALARIAEIAAVDGLDGLYVGPTDLSLSLGCKPGDEVEPKVAQAIERILDCARDRNLATGIYNGTAAAAAARARQGFRLLSIGSDARFLATGSQQSLAEFNSY